MAKKNLGMSVYSMQNHYEVDDQFRHGLFMLPQMWTLLENNTLIKTITLTKKRVLRCIGLGFWIMPQEKGGKYEFSVVGIEEIENETPVSTTIPEKKFPNKDWKNYKDWKKSTNKD